MCYPPEKQRSSHVDLPATTAPASRSRATTVASTAGTNPSTVREPFIIGTPATAVLSLTATRRPASGPSVAPPISVVTYQALFSFLLGSGDAQDSSGEVGAIAE